MSTKDDKSSSLPEAQPITEEPLTIEALQATTSVDLKELIKINEKSPGLGLREKGKLLGCSHALVKLLQDKLNIIQFRTKNYRENRAEILQEGQRRILNHLLTEDSIKEMSARDKAVTFGILFDKEVTISGLDGSPKAFNIYVKEVHLAVKQGKEVPLSPFNSNTKHPIIDVSPLTKELSEPDAGDPLQTDDIQETGADTVPVEDKE